MQKPVLSYADRFVDVLEPGETLQWTGQPRKGIIFRHSDAMAIPFSVLWCGFACFWEASALGLTGFKSGHGAPLLFKLWGIPFVVTGIYVVVGRFIDDAWRRSHTYYAVTNFRVLIVERRLNLKVTSLALENLPFIERTMSGNDEGSLSFASPTIPLQGRRGVKLSGTPACPTFEFICGAREVEQLIRSSELPQQGLGVNQLGR
jgi:hypothetical protein